MSKTHNLLLKNLGAKLLWMCEEDWRSEQERMTLGMAGHWLEKLGDGDLPPLCSTCGRGLLKELETDKCVICEENHNSKTKESTKPQ